MESNNEQDFHLLLSLSIKWLYHYSDKKQCGTLKFGTKVGVKSIFHLMKFFDSRPNNRSGRVLAFLAWFGYFGYFWSKRSGTLKFGTKVGVKSMFHFMTFFDSRPNNRAIDFFGFAAKVQCNSLRGPWTPIFLSLRLFCITMPYRINNKKWPDSFFKFSLGLICPPRTCE